jgi:uncharacterized phage infection (PIP) family protein YhgE
MEKMDKDVVKKEKEIEKLKQKQKEDEDKHKRELSRKNEEIKELNNRVKELIKEKQDATIAEEQASHEKENVLKQLTDLQDENKRLHEQLTQIGILKAEVSGLKLKNETQLKKASELEQTIKGKDAIIEQLKNLENQLRQDISNRITEITQKEAEVNQLKSDKTGATQFVERSEGTIKQLKEEIAQLNKNLNDQRLENTKLKSEMDRLENDLNQLNQTVKDKEAEISKISGETGSIITRNEELEKEVLRLKKGIEEAEAGIISTALPNIVKGDKQALSRIIEIARNTKHNAVISIPTFENVPEVLKIDTLRASTQLRIMTFVDFKSPQHKAIFSAINNPNILIRHNDDKNLWGIIRDQEEVLIAPADSAGTPLGMIVKDPNQIRILGNLMLDTWSKCRRNVEMNEFAP